MFCFQDIFHEFSTDYEKHLSQPRMPLFSYDSILFGQSLKKKKRNKHDNKDQA